MGTPDLTNPYATVPRASAEPTCVACDAKATYLLPQCGHYEMDPISWVPVCPFHADGWFYGGDFTGSAYKLERIG